MSLVDDYRAALSQERLARLRRTIALRALIAEGATQTEIARELGISQSAVSQQLKVAERETASTDPATLLDASRPTLRSLAAEHGYQNLAVFGSVATGRATLDSDIDLLVEPPEATSSFDLMHFKDLIERVLGRQIDLVTYSSLTPGLDDDIRSTAIPL